MRILRWVQNKFNGKQEKHRFDVGSSSARNTSIQDACKEEFSDWPQALLSIGTFGNKELKEDPQTHEASEDLDLSQNLPDFTSEEVRKLQKELIKLLSGKSKTGTKGLEVGEEEKANLPLNRFLYCPSSFDIDRIASLSLHDDLDRNNGDLSPKSMTILKKAKNLLFDNRDAIKKKSLAFLLKKFFVCRSGFSSPAPSLRDPIPESTMEKILRTLLHKKIYPRNSTSYPTRKCLEERPMDKVQGEKKEEKGEDRCKWVNTDSEYIVLEM